jgi:Ca-activated chloride channel family protein
MSNWIRVAALAAAVGMSLSCGASLSSGGFGGEAGATPGGAQDLALAREKVKQGLVPAVADLPYEGLYSEHDLPIEGPRCDQILCVRAGSAVTVDGAAGAPTGWVQLGLSSNVDLSTFKRRPLNAAIVIDHSGSMGTDKMEAAKAAALKLVDLLNEDDLLTVVMFDDRSQVLIGPAPVVDKEAFRTQVKSIFADGSTCIECGLKDGFAALESMRSGARANRLFLFTDAQPNVGATGDGEFMQLLEGAAEHELYASVFGVGLDFGQALTTRITSVAGANAFFLADPERTRKVFDEDFDLLVTPLAFDLAFTLEPAAPMAVAKVYGVPGEPPTQFAQTVKTVFLSRKKGALVVELSGAVPEGTLGSLRLSYRTVEATSVGPVPVPVQRSTPYESSVSVAAPEGAAPAYSGSGTRKAVALTRMLTAMRLACEKHARGDSSGARADAQAAVTVVEAEATAMGDPALAAEVDFAKALLALLP